MKVSDFIEQAGRPIAYYPEFAKALKSVNATIFLCQLLYWKGKGKKKNGWIYKSRKEMEEETALSRREQDTARRILKTAGILKEKLAGVPATVHYKINTDKLNEIVETYLEQKELSRLAESAKLDCTKRVNLNGGNEQTIHRLPETTNRESISRPEQKAVRPVSLSKEKREAIEKEISEKAKKSEEFELFDQADGFLDTLDIQSRINMIDVQSGSTKTIAEMMDYVIYYESKTGRKIKNVPAFIYCGLREDWESGNYRQWGLEKLKAGGYE